MSSLRMFTVRHSLRIFLAAVLIVNVVVAPIAEAADLSVAPSAGTYSVGQRFTTTIIVSSADQAMNAASGVISFPKETLEVVSLSKATSMISLWVQEPSFSNSDGTIRFEGIVPNPGFAGVSGKILDITFRAKSAGTAKLNFSASSVLANDGQGTNILLKAVPAEYIIGGAPVVPSVPTEGTSPAPVVTSSTHPNEAQWYALSDVQVSWKLPSDVTAVRLLTNQLPNSQPTVTYDPPISEKLLEQRPDGVWYLHVQFQHASGWGSTKHFTYRIDTESPTGLVVSEESEGKTDGMVKLRVSATDEQSGIEKYVVSEGTVIKTEGANPIGGILDVRGLTAGTHMLTVSAYDYAGNTKSRDIQVTVKGAQQPTIDALRSPLKYGESLIVQGSAAPNSTVSIKVANEAGEIVAEQQTSSDALGRYTLIVEKNLYPGEYSVRVGIVSVDGGVSTFSESSPFTVWLGIMWTVLIALLVVALIFTSTLLWRMKRTATGFASMRRKYSKIANKHAGAHTQRALQELLAEFSTKVDALEKEHAKQSEYKDELKSIHEMKAELDAMQAKLSIRISELERKINSQN